MPEQYDDRSFTHVDLPRVGKRVLRLGVAGNYGLSTSDIHHAADRGVGFWAWSPSFKKVTPALKEIVAREREDHVVVAYGWGYTPGMVSRRLEKCLRLLDVAYLDLYLLGWLGRMSAFTERVQHTLVRMREQGLVRALAVSIHDRKRAGRLARDSILDAFMLRYNAKHPGAEEDVFPHLEARNPIVIAYTATSWRQLLRPVKGIDMPPWSGKPQSSGTPPPLSPELCYRFCLSSPHVHVVFTGPRNRSQLDTNLDALGQGPLTQEEMNWVRRYGQQVKAKKRMPYI
jgi:aryl-alcohol dehydrogenase-like predicted oxidoreductase